MARTVLLMLRLPDLSPSQTSHQLLQRLGAPLKRPSSERWRVPPKLAKSRGSLSCLLLWRRWEVAVEQTKRIGAALSRHQGIEENIAIKQLFQRISITLVRGNATILMSRRPDSGSTGS